MSETTLSKADLIDAIRSASDCTKKDATLLFDHIIEAILQELNNNGEVNISQFGSFSIKHREARQVRNPQTGGMVDVAASNSITFKPTKSLKELVEAS